MRLPGPLSLAVWMLASFASPAFATLPFVTHISTNPDPACPTVTTHLVIDGMFATTCGRVLGTEQFGAERVIVNLRPFATQDTACGNVSQPWRREFDLGQLPAGPRSVDVEIRVYSADANEPPQIVSEPFAFTVEPTCGGGTNTLPYVSTIGITPAPPCRPATVVLSQDRQHRRLHQRCVPERLLRSRANRAAAVADRRPGTAAADRARRRRRQHRVCPAPLSGGQRSLAGVHGSSTTAGRRIRTDRPAGGRDVRRGHRPQSRVPNDSGLRRR